jgi:hypothetical protein
MVQYPRPYGFTHLYASRSEDLTISHIYVKVNGLLTIFTNLEINS